MLEPGDILFSFGKGFVSKLIRFATGGNATHVGIMYTDSTIFETDGKWGRAEMHNLINQYKGKKVEIYRYKGLNLAQKRHIRALCEEYKGKPYSYWDIATKGALFWIPAKIRSKIVTLLGTDDFLICNELVMLIMWKVTGDRMFKEFEGSSPAELLKDVTQRNKKKFDRIV